jgi:hypothetical protein
MQWRFADGCRETWTIRENGQGAVGTRSDPESKKDDDKEFYYSASVNVTEQSISEETLIRFPSYIDKEGEEQPLYWSGGKTVINRASGKISYRATVETKYSAGFTGKTLIDLVGVCKEAGSP